MLLERCSVARFVARCRVARLEKGGLRRLEAGRALGDGHVDRRDGAHLGDRLLLVRLDDLCNTRATCCQAQQALENQMWGKWCEACTCVEKRSAVMPHDGQAVELSRKPAEIKKKART